MTASSLSKFADSYYLWSEIIFLSALGLYHLITILICQGFRSLGEIHEAYCGFKTRIVENRLRHEQAVAARTPFLSNNP